MAATARHGRRRPGVLHVIQHREPSGAEVAHLPLLRADPDPLLACPPDSATERLARGHGIPTVALPYRTMRQSAGFAELVRSGGRILLAARDLRRILRAHPDRPIVVGNTLTPSLVGSLAAVGLRGRRPVWIAAQFLPRRSVRLLVRLVAALTAARVIVPSHAVREQFVGRSRRLARRTRVVAPGVELDRFGPREPGDRGPTVAVIGYISPVKRTDMALDVAARLASELPGLRLLIAGTAQYRPEDFALEAELTRRVASDPVLARHVELCGHVRDIPGLLAGVSAMLHCCPVETFGMALVEAMAAGVPVVAPAAGGPLDIVEPGTTGLLYAAEDRAAAAAALREVLREPDRAAAMGAAARARAERLFSGAGYVERFSAAIEGLAGA